MTATATAAPVHATELPRGSVTEELGFPTDPNNLYLQTVNTMLDAAELINLKHRTRIILAQPKNEIMVHFPVLMDDGHHKLFNFRGYLLWLTFPPMALLFMDRPFGLIVAYGALGALFMPFLALTLIWLLNSARTPAEWRSRWLSNGMLAAGGVLFCFLAGRELLALFS